jgi:RNA-directed DNA polymerase
MKRANNIFQEIIDPENLRLAFWKASKGKRWKAEVIKFQKSLHKNLLSLREKIESGDIGNITYRIFKIKDPKERIICAAPFEHRVIHHAIMNCCHSFFERFQIFHSYASRRGKGTYSAIDQAIKNQKKYSWYAKLDVKKHFDNIDHSVLLNQLKRLFKEDILIYIFEKIILSYSTFDGKGLPIGNLTSQYFANHYLGYGDHYLHQKLSVPAYIRYMDDMVIWSNSKTELIGIVKKFEKYVNEELFLKLKPICLNKSSKGLPFCGYIIFPQKINLNFRSRRRYRYKLKLYTKYLYTDYWNQEQFQLHIQPLIAFTRNAEAKNYRRKCLENLKYGNDQKQVEPSEPWRQLEQQSQEYAGSESEQQYS